MDIDTGSFTEALNKRESEEQGAGGWPSAAGRNCLHVGCQAVPLLGMNFCAQHAYEAAGQSPLAQPSGQDVAVQAFTAGGEIARVRQDQADILALVKGHNANLAALNQALGDFRDKVMVPIREELKFLRYNLGDKANTTVSQMQGVLGHFDKLFVGLLKASGKDEGQIEAIRISLGIPANLPSLEQLEAEGRPAVDSAAQSAAIESLMAQNQRLIEANEKQRARHAEQLQTLIARIERLESPAGAAGDKPVLDGHTP